MKCIIIDDEPLAVDIVASYIDQIDALELVGSFNNPLEAIPLLSKSKIDLAFIDIEMPNLSGLELARNLDNLPYFVFTTAYPQYAVEGFELNAVDYLLKPIRFHRFLKAVSRVREKLEWERSNQPKPQVVPTEERSGAHSFVFVKSEYENIKLEIGEILYLKGLRDYIQIYIKGQDKSVLTLSNFKELLEKLPNTTFLRTHRSYAVNINHINAVQKNKILIEGERIPIGETYKEMVYDTLGV
ncbi:LytR/AlgR family response regulator transcription factor [Sediminicola luteus]|uniref:DNA-binding response regulator n=1 Tax=Sediminicola luteus TaxID=319238 RepID=A0A2A4G4I6_9FLAO|nr:response regulator transcription factor [Sediminicola luteus]PCE62645.1 DNA-binding response regulator [Sediminicola luteus]